MVFVMNNPHFDVSYCSWMDLCNTVFFNYGNCILSVDDFQIADFKPRGNLNRKEFSKIVLRLI